MTAAAAAQVVLANKNKVNEGAIDGNIIGGQSIRYDCCCWRLAVADFARTASAAALIRCVSQSVIIIIVISRRCAKTKGQQTTTGSRLVHPHISPEGELLPLSRQANR